MPASNFPSLAPCLLLLASCLSGQQGKAPQDASAVLQETEKALVSLHRVSYLYRRELNYASEGYHNILEGNVTIEFDPALQPIGAMYQAHNDAGFDFFNGSEIVSGMTATHTLQILPVRGSEALERSSFLYNSMVTLRRGLPALLSDSAIAKTVTSQTATTTVVEVRISRAVLNATGTLSPILAARDTLYTITIDRATSLPIEIRQNNTQNQDSMLVQFMQVNTKPAKLPASSWFYSSYTDYHSVSPGMEKKLAAVGSSAPEWTLPVASQPGRKSSLADALANPQTKLVLLEFWISFCGHSIDSVPKLNAIADRFSQAGLSVLAINPDDNDHTIQLFIRNNAPRYTLLEEGQKTEDAYGVSSFPTAFLIDKQSKIVYAGPVDEAMLTQKIAALLQ
jgi:thiol-disulfide isomerase/thioredoxin